MAVTKATTRIGIMKYFAFMLVLLSIEEPDSCVNSKDINLFNFHRYLLISIYHIVVCQVIFKFKFKKAKFSICHELKPIICQNFLSKAENSYLMG